MLTVDVPEGHFMTRHGLCSPGTPQPEDAKFVAPVYFGREISTKARHAFQNAEKVSEDELYKMGIPEYRIFRFN